MTEEFRAELELGKMMVKARELAEELEKEKIARRTAEEKVKKYKAALEWIVVITSEEGEKVAREFDWGEVDKLPEAALGGCKSVGDDGRCTNDYCEGDC